MLRSTVTKMMWVGRATVFMVGLAVIVALVFGVVSTAFGANGDFFTLGEKNVASSTSTLVKRGLGPPLSLQPDDGPPLKTNSRIKVTNLNADKLDGFSSEQLTANATVFSGSPPSIVGSTGGIASVSRAGTGDYCLEPETGFQLRDRGVAVTVDESLTAAPEAAASAMTSVDDCGTDGIRIVTERTTLSNNTLVSTRANDISFRIVVAQ